MNTTVKKQLIELDKYLVLENTKILYEGINRLYEVFITEKKINSLLNIKDFVYDEYEKCINIDSSYHHFLSQNINHDFFLFIRNLITEHRDFYSINLQEKRDENPNMDELDYISIAVIEKYLKFCVDINTALYNEGNRTIFYAYNSIATDIFKLFNYEFCFIVYSDNVGETILDTSDYKDIISINSFDGTQRIYQIVTTHKYKRSKKNLTLTDTVLSFNFAEKVEMSESVNNEMYQYVSICIDLPQNQYENEMKSVYIVLLSKNQLDANTVEYIDENNNIVETNKATLSAAAFLLSFKYTLQTLLKRDISALLSLNYNNSYDDIEKISSGDGIEILHLTDLHISTKNYKTIESILMNKKFTTNNEDSIFDLVIITGDVVQGNCSARELEENYDKAIEIINIIAKSIWGNKDGVIRSDWRKRILITTGNHDYAFMNELYAVESNRKLQYGQVAKKEGSTMVKFAYFINFIRKVQDTSIGEYIDNDLNEIREYRRLNLSICSLNSCGGASPLRTNKVQLNSQWIEDALKRNNDSNIINYICAVHHVKDYKINYFVDRQEIKWEKLRNPEDSEKLVNLLSAISENLGNTENNCASNENRKMLKTYAKSLSKYEEAIGTELSENILRYLESSSNEYSETWKREIELDFKFSNQDKNEYDKHYEDLKEKLGFLITLGGHEHRYEKRNENVYAGERFFKNDEIHYGVVHLLPKSIDKNVEYFANYSNRTMEWLT